MSDQTSVPAPSPAPEDNAHLIFTHEKSLANKIAKGSEAGDILDQQLAMLGHPVDHATECAHQDFPYPWTNERGAR